MVENKLNMYDLTDIDRAEIKELVNVLEKTTDLIESLTEYGHDLKRKLNEYYEIPYEFWDDFVTEWREEVLQTEDGVLPADFQIFRFGLDHFKDLIEEKE